MSADEIRKVMVDHLRMMESNTMETQNNIARLLALYDEEPYSADGVHHMKVLRGKL